MLQSVHFARARTRTHTQFVHSMGAQIPGARSSWRLIFVWWKLKVKVKVKVTFTLEQSTKTQIGE